MAGTAAQTRDTSHMVLFDVIPETAALRTVDLYEKAWGQTLIASKSHSIPNYQSLLSPHLSEEKSAVELL
ncbi:hypothetical protein BofuT4_uP160110.1 [Botrytis cinerea T4]|uniref:Uncharacterized protein n=1 Tax=Botryotinia fuckeliana (strain T4) TaxID=999810 RepID=G2YU92_BOTF4|nr:hypothetical protein BofuT4_uP160110.1 [Botrytis cinerea T4]